MNVNESGACVAVLARTSNPYLTCLAHGTHLKPFQKAHRVGMFGCMDPVSVWVNGSCAGTFKCGAPESEPGDQLHTTCGNANGSVHICRCSASAAQDCAAAQTCGHWRKVNAVRRVQMPRPLPSHLLTGWPSPPRGCFRANSWATAFNATAGWREYSQGLQDSVLVSLFNSSNLGATNQEFVEFGFHEQDILLQHKNYTGRHALWDPKKTQMIGYGGNTEILQQSGWHGIRFDGHMMLSQSQPVKNMYTEMITAQNVVSVFRKYDVRNDVDYVSIDIDSCDLWYLRPATGTQLWHLCPRDVLAESSASLTAIVTCLVAGSS